MATPYIGEIRLFAGNFAPVDWMFCQGQLVLISDYDTLFQLIGTTYGGDGQETFQLPDLRGRLPVHQGRATSGNTYTIAQSGGSEDVTILKNELPLHSHLVLATGASAEVASPREAVIGISTTVNAFITSTPSQPMATDIIPVGGGQSHTNMHPYLCLNFIISLYGVFPTPT